MDKIKVGIIGLGRAGWGMHVSELKSFPELFEITAVCDVDFKRAKARKERIHVVRITELVRKRNPLFSSAEIFSHGNVKNQISERKFPMLDPKKRIVDDIRNPIRRTVTVRRIRTESPREILRAFLKGSHSPEAAAGSLLPRSGSRRDWA